MFKKMQKWEYQIEWVLKGREDSTDILRIMGNNGWELVSVRSSHPKDGKYICYYFKRPII